MYQSGISLEVLVHAKSCMHYLKCIFIPTAHTVHHAESGVTGCDVTLSSYFHSRQRVIAEFDSWDSSGSSLHCKQERDSNCGQQ